MQVYKKQTFMINYDTILQVVCTDSEVLHTYITVAPMKAIEEVGKNGLKEALHSTEYNDDRVFHVENITKYEMVFLQQFVL